MALSDLTFRKDREFPGCYAFRGNVGFHIHRGLACSRILPIGTIDLFVDDSEHPYKYQNFNPFA